MVMSRGLGDVYKRQPWCSPLCPPALIRTGPLPHQGSCSWGGRKHRHWWWHGPRPGRGLPAAVWLPLTEPQSHPGPEKVQVTGVGMVVQKSLAWLRIWLWSQQCCDGCREILSLAMDLNIFHKQRMGGCKSFAWLHPFFFFKNWSGKGEKHGPRSPR